MQIEREKLLTLLNIIRPGVARKEIVEQSTHFVFTGRQAVTYNEQICVCAPFKTDFTCSIQAEEFTKLIKSIRAEVLEIDVIESEGKNAITIKAGKVDAEFAVSSNDKITDLIKQLKINTLGKLWQPVPDDFVQGLKWCLFSASQDATQAVLTCLYIKKKTIVSSDDMRVSIYSMDKGLPAEMLIPAVSVEELVKFGISQFCIIEPWAYFKTEDGAIFCAHLVEGQFPDPREFFKFEGSDLELPGDLAHALESAEIMAEGDFPIDKRIKITIEKGMLVVFAKNENLGWIKTKVKMGVKDCPAVSFVINPIFLREILGKTNTVKIGEDRALFQTDNFQHLVSLHGE